MKAADTSRARCWRLMSRPWPEGPKGRRVPCWDFEKWIAPSGEDKDARKARKRAQQRLNAMARWKKAKSQNRFPVVDSSTTAPDAPPKEGGAVVDSSTAIPERDAKPPFVVVGESSTHTAVTTAWCWARDVDWSKTSPSVILTRLGRLKLAA